MVAATVLTLVAAGLHATWNLLLKRAPAGARDLTAWGQYLIGGVLVLPVIVWLGGPGAGAIGWLALSAVIHVAYVSWLVAAYGHGDFSLAYPLARGGGALVAALGGAAVLGDELSVGGWLAVAVVAGGLVSLVGRGVSTTAVRDAALTAVTIGTYTLVDAHGARTATDGLAYGLATTTASAVGLSIWFGARGRLPALRADLRRGWPAWTVAGLAMATAYGLVLVAVRHAPVGYVAMLRESSVVIGAAVGWLVLHEPLGARRLVSSVVILAGLAGLIVASI